jgi:FkbM family methyltransferase
MIRLLEICLGRGGFLKLQAFKKRFFPTKYDQEQLLFISEQVKFYSALVKPNDLCFDVGGNIGLKTHVFLQLGARVVTLEPQQACVDILRAKYGKKAIILQKGAGEKNEIKEFYISTNSALSSFTKGWVDDFKETRFAGSAVQAIERIEVVTLDSIIDTYGKPAFIKIDVEGFELEVLKGLTRNFGCLSFEYAVPEKKENIIQALHYLDHTYSNLACNYAVNNNCHFALEKWLPVNAMIDLVKDERFDKTFAGDIYVKIVSSCV